MSTQTEPKSLYERLGGKDAVHAAVDLFYQKVLADDRVKTYVRRRGHEESARETGGIHDVCLRRRAELFRSVDAESS